MKASSQGYEPSSNGVNDEAEGAAQKSERGLGGRAAGIVMVNLVSYLYESKRMTGRHHTTLPGGVASRAPITGKLGEVATKWGWLRYTIRH